MLLLLSTIRPLNGCLLQNFLASLLLTNSRGIFMLITFAKRPVRLLACIHRSFHSAPINTRRTLYLSLVRLILEYSSTIWHPLNIKLTNRIESTQRFVCRVILQQWKLSDDKLLLESDLPTLAKCRDVATLCHLFKVFHGLCSSPNPYRPHPHPCLRHLNSSAVDPLFAVFLFQSYLFTHTPPLSGLTCPKPLLSPLPSKPSNWPSTLTFFSQFCLCIFPAILFSFMLLLLLLLLLLFFFFFFFWFGMFLYFFVHFLFLLLLILLFLGNPSIYCYIYTEFAWHVAECYKYK